MARLDQLTDQFQDTTINPSLWSAFATGTATQGRSNGQIVFTPGASNATAGYGGYDSAGATRDMTGSYAYIQVAQAVNAAAGVQQYFKVAIDGNNAILFMLENGTLNFQKQVTSTTTNMNAGVAFNIATMGWWRIRENQGITYWDTSADGDIWTNQFNVANPIAVTSLFTEFAAGTYLSVASPGVGIFDNFNTSGQTPIISYFMPGQSWVRRFAKNERMLRPVAGLRPATAWTSTLTATFSTSGNLNKTTARSLTATQSASGSLAKQAARIFAATYKGTGLITSRALARTLTATYSAAGAITRFGTRLFTATASTAGSIARAITVVPFTATQSTSGSISKRTNRNLTATQSASGAITKKTNRSISGTASTSGSLNKKTSRNLSGTASTSGILSTLHGGAHFAAFTGTFSAAGTLVKKTSRTFTATYRATGFFQAVKTIIPPVFVNIVATIGSFLQAATANDSNTQNVNSSATIDNISTPTGTDTLQNPQNAGTLNSPDDKTNLQG